jgi:hypothetical protein
VYGNATATTGVSYGVVGYSASNQGYGVYGNATATTGVTYGVVGYSASVAGVGLAGNSTAVSGATMGLRAINNSPSGTAGVFDALGGGKILSGRTTGLVEKFSVDGSGNVVAAGSLTATSFIGSGASLTGVNAATLNGKSDTYFAALSAMNTFTALATGSGFNQGSVVVNPASANADDTLFGLGVGGTQKLKVDAEGDVSSAGTITLATCINIRKSTTVTDTNGAAFTLPNAAVGGGLIMEDTCQEVGESAGFGANGDSAAVWSPGDGGLLNVYDSDRFLNSGAGLAFRVENNAIYVGASGNNGDDNTSNIYFFDNGNRSNEWMSWDNVDDRFEFSDGLQVQGDTEVSGNLNVVGTLSKGGGTFKIDHPLDPANKYLYHSFVESPDMMNIYNGVVLLDSKGEAWVEMPAWFQKLNSDYRYQLTPIGAPGPNLYVAEEIQGNRFKIAGGKPGSKVSWEVTGIRQDPFAQKHRVVVEEEKAAADRGFYLYPEAYGLPKEKSIAWAMEERSKAEQAKAAANVPDKKAEERSKKAKSAGI